MKPWIASGIILVPVMMASAWMPAPGQGTGLLPATLPAASPTARPVTVAFCAEYTSSAWSIFVSHPEQEGNDIPFACEDGSGDTSLEYLTVKVNAGTTWRTTEPWGVLGTGKGTKPGEGAEFRVRGEGTAGLDRVVITAPLHRWTGGSHPDRLRVNPAGFHGPGFLRNGEGDGWNVGIRIQDSPPDTCLNS